MIYKKQRWIAVGVALGVGLSLGGCSTKSEKMRENQGETIEETDTETENPNSSTESDLEFEKVVATENATESEPESDTEPEYSGDAELEELLLEDQTSDIGDKQRNSINLLNYITVLTQEINDSKESRLFLEDAYSSLINNMALDAVDTTTQAQITSILDTLEQYRMITVKRERLEYIYEQNKAQALRKAIPNPIGLLSTIQSQKPLQIAASVVYMAVDAASSYSNAKTQAELQYLQNGWELDDSEAAELHNSRKTTFNYMLNMVRDNSLPGDYTLNEESAENFVEWRSNSNVVRRIEWLESNQETYKEFGPYWLELAKAYYESQEYQKCLDAIAYYKKISTKIFRRDFDYAQILPLAIVAAKEVMNESEYISTAEKYAELILQNSKENDWALRYFAAETYMTLYAETKKMSYIEKAYDIAMDNVNVLIDAQKEQNQEYISEYPKVKAEIGDYDSSETKDRKKQEADQYNRWLEQKRKKALPPIDESLYLNCSLLFSLADELNISDEEKGKVDSMLHENGENLFLSDVIDDKFWLGEHDIYDPQEAEIKFEGSKLFIPVTCLTEQASVSVEVSRKDDSDTIDDWKLDKVDSSNESDLSQAVAQYSSKKGVTYSYKSGDIITVTVTPNTEYPDDALTYEFTYKPKKVLPILPIPNFERRK